MSERKSRWTVDRFRICLESIIHEENFVQLTDDEVKKYEEIRFFEKPGLQEIIEKLYKKSDGKWAIYGSVSDLVNIFINFERIPQFGRYGEDGYKIADSLLKGVTVIKLTDMNNTTFISKHDWCLAMYNYYVSSMYFSEFDIHYKFIFNYMRMFADITYELLDTSFEFVHQIVLPNLVDGSDLSPKQNEVGQFEVPSPITEEDFDNLRNHVETPYHSAVTDFMTLFRIFIAKAPVSENQEYYTEEYSKIRVFIMRVKILSETLRPFDETLENDFPYVRIFGNEYERFVLAKELDNALRIVMKKIHPNKVYRPEFCSIESEEDRKKGIQNTVAYDKYMKILSICNLQAEHIHELRHLLVLNNRQSAYPIFSNYAKHCKPARDVFLDVFYYLTSILRIFQCCKIDKLPKVLEWIDALADVFCPKKTLFLLEISKIEELIKRAREELKIYKTEKEVNIPAKLTRQKKVLLENVKKLMGKNRFNFKDLEMIHLKTEERVGGLFTYQYTYLLYNQLMLLEVLKKLPKIRAFIVNQTPPHGENTSLLTSTQIIVHLLGDGQPAVPSSSSAVNNPQQYRKTIDEKLQELTKKNQKVNIAPPTPSVPISNENRLFHDTAVQISGVTIRILAHFPEDEFRPISYVKLILDIYYSHLFDSVSWNRLEEIFKSHVELETLFGIYLFFFFEFKIENDDFWVKKKVVYSSNMDEQRVIEQAIEAERERVKNFNLRSELEKKEAECLKKEEEIARLVGMISELVGSEEGSSSEQKDDAEDDVEVEITVDAEFSLDANSRIVGVSTVDTEPEVDAEYMIDAEPETNPQAKGDTEPVTCPETVPEAENDTEEKVEVEFEVDAEFRLDAESKIVAVSTVDAEPETEACAEPKADAEPPTIPERKNE